MDLAKRLKNGQCNLRDGSVAGQWRLPRREEWENLVDENARDPALPANYPFIGVQSNGYWSSTSDASGTSNAWYMGLNYGYGHWDAKTGGNYVWSVRGGQ